MKDNKIKKWLYYFSLAIAIILIYKFLDNFIAIGAFISKLFQTLMPFFMGVLIAYILYIPCRSIEKCFEKTKFKFIKKHRRGISIFTIYIIVAIILFILLNVILPPVVSSVSDLLKHLPEYYNIIASLINKIPSKNAIIKLNAEDIINNISNIDFASYLSIENITNYIKGVISVASGVFSVFVTIIISIYTLAGREMILNFIKKVVAALFSEKEYSIIAKYFRKTNQIFFNFISGQLLDAIIIGIATTIVMSIMKVKYAMLLGFIIGLFNLIPFFGAIVAICISVIITICTGGISQAIWLAIIITIVQQIDANIINPKILGDKLKISPILVIFSVTLAGAYFGVLGMFLAVPIIAVIKLLSDDYLDYKTNRKSKQ